MPAWVGHHRGGQGGPRSRPSASVLADYDCRRDAPFVLGLGAMLDLSVRLALGTRGPTRLCQNTWRRKPKSGAVAWLSAGRRPELFARTALPVFTGPEAECLLCDPIDGPFLGSSWRTSRVCRDRLNGGARREPVSPAERGSCGCFQEELVIAGPPITVAAIWAVASAADPQPQCRRRGQPCALPPGRFVLSSSQPARV
jgi:hypothetical protein